MQYTLARTIPFRSPNHGVVGTRVVVARLLRKAEVNQLLPPEEERRAVSSREA